MRRSGGLKACERPRQSTSRCCGQAEPQTRCTASFWRCIVPVNEHVPGRRMPSSGSRLLNIRIHAVVDPAERWQGKTPDIAIPRPRTRCARDHGSEGKWAISRRRRQRPTGSMVAVPVDIGLVLKERCISRRDGVVIDIWSQQLQPASVSWSQVRAPRPGCQGRCMERWISCAETLQQLITSQTRR